jgi:hypothetical protein
MKQRYNTLDIRIIHRPSELNADGSGKHGCFTVDFLVDGQSLYELLLVDKLDLVGRFSKGAQTWNEESADIFLAKQPADLENGRTMLYVCPECGDIGCGAITLTIIESDDVYSWTEFGYENNYDPQMMDLDSYRTVGPFQFQFEEYCKVIEKAKAA